MTSFSNMTSIFTSAASSEMLNSDVLERGSKPRKQNSLCDLVFSKDRALLDHFKEEERGQRGRRSELDRLSKKLDLGDIVSSPALATISSGRIGEILKNGALALSWSAAAAAGMYFSASAALGPLPESTVGILGKAGGWGLVLGLSFVAAWQGFSKASDSMAHCMKGTEALWSGIGDSRDARGEFLSSEKERKGRSKGNKGHKSKGKRSGKNSHDDSDD